MTPEFRRDPLHNTWVVFAPERQRRPQDFLPAILQAGALDPFAEGNERLTPPEVYAIRKEKTETERARLARARRAESLSRHARSRASSKATPGGTLRPPDRHRRARGHHRDARRRSSRWRTCSVTAIAEVFASYRERIIDLDKDLRFQHIYIFKNVGPSAGASLAHAHSQLVALPLVPPFVEGKLIRAREHYQLKQRSLFSDILHTERADGSRLVAENDGYVLFCPFASRFPFELAIFPKRHHPEFISCTHAPNCRTWPKSSASPCSG